MARGSSKLIYTLLTLALACWACEAAPAASSEPDPVTVDLEARQSADAATLFGCPEGSALFGPAPPYGARQWCALEDGTLHGREVRYRDGRGNIRREGRYVNGARDGRWVHYHKSGRVASEGSFAEGKQHGTFEFYYKNGKLKERAVYNHGHLVKMEQFSRFE